VATPGLFILLSSNALHNRLEIGAIVEIPNIYYDLSKWNIRPDAAIELAKVVQFLNDNPTVKVELGSHTDSRGSDSSNQVLSQNRAQAAVDFIVRNGTSDELLQKDMVKLN
jgi:outer membrane protein OmpA-like peptidoglycan-associated protein